jgi:hypothetical protein
MDKFETQEKLWALPAYRALDQRRRKACTAHIVDGESLTKACSREKLNPSREKNGAFMVAVRTFNELYRPAEAVKTRDRHPVLNPWEDPNLSIYEQADALEKYQAEKRRQDAHSSDLQPVSAPPAPATSNITPAKPVELPRVESDPIWRAKAAREAADTPTYEPTRGKCSSCGAPTSDPGFGLCDGCRVYVWS